MTKEEILKSKILQLPYSSEEDWNYGISTNKETHAAILEAMEEYALEYHNERLREEIEKFVLWNEGDCRPEYNTKIVNRYMRNYEM